MQPVVELASLADSGQENEDGTKKKRPGSEETKENQDAPHWDVDENHSAR